MSFTVAERGGVLPAVGALVLARMRGYPFWPAVFVGFDSVPSHVKLMVPTAKQWAIALNSKEWTPVEDNKDLAEFSEEAVTKLIPARSLKDAKLKLALQHARDIISGANSDTGLSIIDEVIDVSNSKKKQKSSSGEDGGEEEEQGGEEEDEEEEEEEEEEESGDDDSESDAKISGESSSSESGSEDGDGDDDDSGKKSKKKRKRSSSSRSKSSKSKRSSSSTNGKSRAKSRKLNDDDDDNDDAADANGGADDKKKKSGSDDDGDKDAQGSSKKRSRSDREREPRRKPTNSSRDSVAEALKRHKMDASRPKNSKKQRRQLGDDDSSGSLLSSVATSDEEASPAAKKRETADSASTPADIVRLDKSRDFDPDEEFVTLAKQVREILTPLIPAPSDPSAQPALELAAAIPAMDLPVDTLLPLLESGRTMWASSDGVRGGNWGELIRGLKKNKNEAIAGAATALYKHIEKSIADQLQREKEREERKAAMAAVAKAKAAALEKKKHKSSSSSSSAKKSSSSDAGSKSKSGTSGSSSTPSAAAKKPATTPSSGTPKTPGTQQQSQSQSQSQQQKQQTPQAQAPKPQTSTPAAVLPKPAAKPTPPAAMPMGKLVLTGPAFSTDELSAIKVELESALASKNTSVIEHALQQLSTRKVTVEQVADSGVGRAVKMVGKTEGLPPQMVSLALRIMSCWKDLIPVTIG